MEELFCPNCGARPAAGARFCFRCGQPLGAAADAAFPAPVAGEEPHDEPSAGASPAVGSRVPWPGEPGTGTYEPIENAPARAEGAYAPPPASPPPPVAVYDAPPPKRRSWLLPVGLVLAALLAFLAWRGVQSVVRPSSAAWTPGPTSEAGTAIAVAGTLTPETPVSRARPATSTPTPTVVNTATASPTNTGTPTPKPAALPPTSIPTLTSAPPSPTFAPPTAGATAVTPRPTQGGGPVPAPGDRLIAFVSEASGRPQIHVVQADGRSARQITTEGANRGPAWSPDNASLYYVSERGDRSGIYRYDLVTGREEPVALGSGLGRPQPVAGIALSATQRIARGHQLLLGDRIVFELNRPFDYHWLPDGSQVLIDPLQDPREIYAVNLADGKVTMVAPQRSWNASWGPRGEILFVSNNPGVALAFVADNNGANPRRVSPEDQWAQAPAWSPDGQWIAYVAGDGPAWNLYRVNPNGEGAMRLANAANQDKSPAWEPNRNRLAYESNPRGDWDVVVVDANGNARTVAGSEANEYDPVWSN